MFISVYPPGSLVIFFGRLYLNCAGVVDNGVVELADRAVPLVSLERPVEFVDRARRADDKRQNLRRRAEVELHLGEVARVIVEERGYAIGLEVAVVALGRAVEHDAKRGDQIGEILLPRLATDRRRGPVGQPIGELLVQRPQHAVHALDVVVRADRRHNRPSEVGVLEEQRLQRRGLVGLERTELDARCAAGC